MRVIDLTNAAQKRRFLARIDDLLDEVPISKEEAVAFLRQLGIDPEKARQRTMALIEHWTKNRASA